VSRGIRKENFYPDPPEAVWVALTDPRALAEWLMPNNFKPEVGHRFYFQTDPMPMCEAKTECEVIECEPPHRLAYTWLIVWRKQYKTEPQPMVVSWTLTPENGGTRLVFEQSPYAGPRAFWTRFSMNLGWGMMHKRLMRKVLANVRDGAFTPGAIPIEKRCYKARAIPDELAR
jgi:uncharacterized protein YndB with AHSA1/START domain